MFELIYINAMLSDAFYVDLTDLVDLNTGELTNDAVQQQILDTHKHFSSSFKILNNVLIDSGSFGCLFYFLRISCQNPTSTHWSNLRPTSFK